MLNKQYRICVKFQRKKIAVAVQILLNVVILVVGSFLVLCFYKTSKQADYEKAVIYSSEGKYKEAFEILIPLGEYKDSEEMRIAFSEKIAYNDAKELIQNGKYKEGYELLSTLGNYQESVSLKIEALSKYLIKLQEEEKKSEFAAIYFEAMSFLGNTLEELKFTGKEIPQNLNDLYNAHIEKSFEDAQPGLKVLEEYNMAIESNAVIIDSQVYKNASTISPGLHYAVAIDKNGKAIATSYNEDGQSSIEEWEDIISISAKGVFTLGLKPNGTVVVAGKHKEVIMEVSDWNNIVDIASGYLYVVGLKDDGTAIARGHNGDGQGNVQDWKDIIDISAGWRHTVGLDKNGKVHIVGFAAKAQRDKIERNLEGWSNIVAVAAGGGDSDGSLPEVLRLSGHTVGLRSDGTVVAVAASKQGPQGQCDVEGWKDIVAIAAGDYHTVGLDKYGKVHAVGYNNGGGENDPTDVSEWKNIVAIAAGTNITIGVDYEGNVYVAGENRSQKRTDVQNWGKVMTYNEWDIMQYVDDWNITES
jgi:hypothetical protein